MDSVDAVSTTWDEGDAETPSLRRGVSAGEPRPALVVHDDRVDATESVTVSPFTTTALDAPLLRVGAPSSGANGLDHESFLMIDTITTIHRSNAHGVLGERLFSNHAWRTWPTYSRPDVATTTDARSAEPSGVRTSG